MSSEKSKRGPLSKPGGAPSRQHYVCQVQGCEAVVRGDQVRDHYKRLVDERCLDDMFKNVYGLTYQARLNKMSLEERAHTLHFQEHNLKLNLLPKFITSDRTHWKPLITTPKLNPFQRMENKRKLTNPGDDDDTQNYEQEHSKMSRTDVDTILDENSNFLKTTPVDDPINIPLEPWGRRNRKKPSSNRK